MLNQVLRVLAQLHFRWAPQTVFTLAWARADDCLTGCGPHLFCIFQNVWRSEMVLFEPLVFVELVLHLAKR